MSVLNLLNQKHAIENHVQLREIADGMIIAEVANQHALANIALQGAHVATFQPRGEEPVIWLSPLAKFAPGKSIRGGVPICWPWFGPHQTDSKLPGHGFARTVPWELLDTKALEDGSTFLRFGLIENDTTRAQWPHPSTAQLEVTVGKALRVELVTANTGSAPFELGEALHTYLQISDVGNMTIRGLEGCEYIDKVGATTRRTQQDGIVIESEVDRVYVNTAADCVIEDKGLKRAIRIHKEGSRSTVVWNPWTEKAEKMGDFGPKLHRDMVCVESGNAMENAVTVAPGETHRLVAMYSVEKL
ncbi:MAG: D-hexose-6-phosphate mutarotase [Gallionellales bacterium CG_4_9_14_0_8_um_filter_59_50]|nr:MAG: D-hexose-6-phosphate mutarotase [Gallionellales bacterium CG08_land_8_20_14_0_20_59_87]PJC02382.1 MAG: D-hexose-6-phosphate mutarotase [Gallionellales bacterium CG_4_9_14_0_8_um_filter_59_50]